MEEMPKRPSAREIIFEFDRERLEREDSASKPSDGKRKAQRKPRRKAPGRPKKRVLKGVRKKTPKRPSPKKRGPPPLGTVNVVEQGVYEIDVERLLRDDPVIIENDGTYLIHLPSMLNEGTDVRT
jgi:predicted  nucleic acid-binding Zn-ribbon protein